MLLVVEHLCAYSGEKNWPHKTLLRDIFSEGYHRFDSGPSLLATMFALEKLKNKVSHRRASESSILELAAIKSSDRRLSLSNPNSNPMITVSETSHRMSTDPASDHATLLLASLAPPSPQRTSRSRSRSRSLSARPPHGMGLPGTSPAAGRMGSVGSTRMSTKELIKQETALVILKKLLQMLKDMGLQQPIPLKTTHGTSSNSAVLKTTKVFVANTNDCVYLPPASSASFTYEDVENGNQMSMVDVNDLLEAADEENEDSAVFSDDDMDPLSPGSRLRRPSEYPASDRRSSTSAEDPRTTEDPNHRHIPDRLKKKITRFTSPNYLCTRIDSETPIPHTFAVIIELSKDTRSVRDVRFEFASAVSTLWPTSDPYNKSHLRERFNIGQIEWETSLHDADFYINSLNSNDVRIKKLTADDMARRTREYKLVNIRDLAEGSEGPPPKMTTPLAAALAATGHDDEVYKAGLYVFILPILLPEHIPASIVSVNGSLMHSLNVSFSKCSDKLNRRAKVNSTYNLPLVRTPPSFANSIADKPIYVNRVWNDSLHYIITFPRKYVSLGAEHVINVKLVPLVKEVIVKRIRFNVLERITYVSRNLSKEYDYDGEDPFHTKSLHHNDGRVKERIISLCELKTKPKATSNAIGSEPYKEEVVKCPDNNLLFICYEDEREGKRPAKMIASPLDINVALPFLTTKTDKTMMTSSVDEENSTFVNPVQRKMSAPGASRKASVSTGADGHTVLGPFSPVIGMLETNMSHLTGEGQREAPHMDMFTPETSQYLGDDHSTGSVPTNSMQMGYTKCTKALYPDSNFRHIQIHHRLQVCFRISKPDPKDNYKMHHYEVVVDTPLVLVSSKCSEDSIQLPEYDDLFVEDPVAGSQSTAEPENSLPAPISFRTPAFERNGTTIRQYDPNVEDALPSFEEATSGPLSPMMRSFSVSDDPISRIPSITSVTATPMPSDPAPSYDSITQDPPAAPTVPEQSPAYIDEIVLLLTGAAPRRQLVLRSSLASSFAPSSSRTRASSFGTSPKTQSLLLSRKDSSDTSTSATTNNDSVNSNNDAASGSNESGSAEVISSTHSGSTRSGPKNDSISSGSLESIHEPVLGLPLEPSMTTANRSLLSSESLVEDGATGLSHGRLASSSTSFGGDLGFNESTQKAGVLNTTITDEDEGDHTVVEGTENREGVRFDMSSAMDSAKLHQEDGKRDVKERKDLGDNERENKGHNERDDDNEKDHMRIIGDKINPKQNVYGDGNENDPHFGAANDLQEDSSSLNELDSGERDSHQGDASASELSLVADEAAFSQRLPLLLYTSTETIPRKGYLVPSTSNLPTTAEEDYVEQQKQYLTDNLSVVSRKNLYE